MFKKFLFLMVVSIVVNVNADNFLYATCNGYNGDYPLIGRFVGSFSTKQYIPFNINMVSGPILSTTDVRYGALNLKVGSKNIIVSDSGTKISTPGLYYYTTPGCFETCPPPQTFSIYESVPDTVLKIDTVKSTITKTKTDTIIKKDTIRIKDTLIKTKIDTFKVSKTIIQRDTVQKIVYDTVTEIKKDTVKIPQVVNGFKESDKFYYEKLYINSGKPTKTYSGISFGSFDDSGFVSNQPAIQIHTNIKSNVRIFIYDNIGTFVDKEEFRLSENKYYYFSFNGYNSIKQKVVNGIYLIRVITEQNNKFSNTVYKVGIKND